VKNGSTLFLLFQQGKNRYALEASCIQEVLPYVRVEHISHCSSRTGIVNYRGAPILVIDLSQLLSGEPTSPRLSTRIILVRPPGQLDQIVGLLAERVTTMVRYAKEDFVEHGISSQGASRVGPVLLESKGLVQWVKLERLLIPDLIDSSLTKPAQPKP
jgi:chemotaxis-related protein WspB